MVIFAYALIGVVILVSPTDAQFRDVFCKEDSYGHLYGRKIEKVITLHEGHEYHYAPIPDVCGDDEWNGVLLEGCDNFPWSTKINETGFHVQRNNSEIFFQMILTVYCETSKNLSETDIEPSETVKPETLAEKTPKDDKPIALDVNRNKRAVWKHDLVIRDNKEETKYSDVLINRNSEDIIGIYNKNRDRKKST